MRTREAPAKVNLTLDILGRRPDGYHDMRMVMQTISLCDTVSVAETDGGFCLKGMEGLIPEGKKTLEQRAAEAFFEAVGRPMSGLEVTLEKRTPAYAGLGGGSADVAALLRLLRERYCPELSAEELERIGFQVGSDMPFCVRGGTALAEGRGEILTDLPSLPACWFVLCKPEFGIPTPELFARVDGGELTRRPDTEGMLQALEQQDLIFRERQGAGLPSKIYVKVQTENSPAGGITFRSQTDKKLSASNKQRKMKEKCIRNYDYEEGDSL